ncbi:MAG: hypothetical protein JXB10_13145 [Pirellulales bacterium]|nr:hypothetical protein [Pirellulales bacterium]
MQISSIINSFTDTLSLGKKAETAASAASQAASAPEAAVSATASRKVLAEILKKYDVTKITPEEFSQMLKELSQAGVLSEKEIQELSAIRLDLESARFDSNETVNLLDFYNDKIGQIQRQRNSSDDAASQQEILAPLINRLGWLEKFSTIHSHPEAVGVDLAA